MCKKCKKNKYVTRKQTTTTELQAPDFGQAHTYRMWQHSLATITYYNLWKRLDIYFILQYNFVTPLTSMVVTTPLNRGQNNVIDPNGKYIFVALAQGRGQISLLRNTCSKC